MSVPLWFFIACLAVVGIKTLRPPLWLVIVLLTGGYLLADSLFAPAINPFIK
ncbi:hypothetical protein ACIRVK_13445 [Streptomyces sp. NPDC101152]|uniref:hypothetical protein n=1 Tax=Streptomyces sp. NPDC101152 TaxID=3366116 RepID=UPI0037FC40A4